MPENTDQENLPLKGQHIVVVVPSYDGRIPIDIVNSLFGLSALIGANGGEMSFFSQKNMAIIESARNALLAKIMEYPFVTGVLHLDADIEFEPMDALRLIAHADGNYDMMVGLYRAKTDTNYLYFVTWENDGEPVLDGEVLPCKRVPMGFAYVKRKVLDVLWENAKDRPYSIGKAETRMVFETAYRDGTFIGEDYDFCDKVRAAGFRIGALPKINLGHIGTKTFRGSFWDGIEGVKTGQLEMIEGDDARVTL